MRQRNLVSRRTLLGLTGGVPVFLRPGRGAGPADQWLKHGFSEAQYERVVGLMGGAVGQQKIAGGSLLLIHAGEVIFREGFGYADLATKRPFSVDAFCHIASLTKPVTSTVLMQLVDRGKVGLDDPVSKYLPEFAAIKVRDKGRARTGPIIRQLVSHRAGLPGNNEFPERFQELRFAGISLSEMVSEMVRYGLVAEPGARWAYSRGGFMTAGRVVEVVTGKVFNVAMREMLLEPLGMKASTFRPSREQTRLKPLSYERGKDGLRPGRDYTQLPEDFLLNPGGGLYSTIDEMGRFLAMHLAGGVFNGRRVLERSSVEAMQQRQAPIPGREPEHGAYGLGWSLTRSGVGTVRHGGASGTMGWLAPARDIAGVLFTQTRWAGNRPWQTEFARVINDVLGR